MNENEKRVLEDLNRLSLYDCMHNPYYAHRLAKEAMDTIKRMWHKLDAMNPEEVAAHADNQEATV